MININGKSYKGNNVTISNGEVWIDGKLADDINKDEKIINITISANIQKLDIDNCNKLEINGNCKDVTSKNGDIKINGSVDGNVNSKNGNIVCGKVSGDVETKNGNIVHS